MLSQLLEDYKEAEFEDKDQYIDEFKKMIWKSKYTYKVQKKYITFKLNESALNFDKKLIEIFELYQSTEFSLCKSFHKGKLKSADYIRIHINNMYGFLTKPEVYLPKEYYQLMLVPKDEYYKVVENIKNGAIIDVDSIRIKISDSISKAEKIKSEHLNKKIKLTWKDYKGLINKYIDRLFDNYTPIYEYEEKNGWKMEVDTDNWSEDNYVASYFCKSLTGYMRNYVRDSKPRASKVKFCKLCDLEIYAINNRKTYCNTCASEREKNRKLKVWHKNKHKYSS